MTKKGKYIKFINVGLTPGVGDGQSVWNANDFEEYLAITYPKDDGWNVVSAQADRGNIVDGLPVYRWSLCLVKS